MALERLLDCLSPDSLLLCLNPISECYLYPIVRETY